MTHYCLVRLEVLAPHLASAGRDDNGLQFLLCHFAEIEQLSSIFLSCPFPDILSRESMIPLSTPIGVSKLPAPSVPVPGFGGKKEIPGSLLPCCFSYPKFPGQSASSLHFSVFPCYFICDVQDV